MFLKAIHLSNIKCFDKLDLSFEEEAQAGKLRKWTMLLGENGTGKSTLLKTIALVTCGSDGLSDLLPSVSDWIRYGEEEGLIEAVLVTKQGQERKVQLRLKYSDSRTDVIIRNKDSLSWLDRALRESPEAPEAYFVVGFGASRHFSESWHGKTSPFWTAVPRTWQRFSILMPP